jgi:hypothetical protein
LLTGFLVFIIVCLLIIVVGQALLLHELRTQVRELMWRQKIRLH